MNDSIPLGRIAGIRVGVNWSVLVIAVYLVYALSASVFPESNPGLGPGTRLVMGVAAAVLFLASILLHEVGHAVQARRDGMTIDGITLWLFGGVARFVGMFPGAGVEFRVAIAGPLVSLGLGVGFLGVSRLPVPEPVDGVATWLGYINIALLVFNMLPALPMDGGRVLRSALWAWRGDLQGATRIAGALGRGLALLMIAAGLWEAFVIGASVSGIWLALIGLFVLRASTGETRAAVALGALQGLSVRDVMVTDPVTVAPHHTLGDVEAFTRWTGARYTSCPVVDEDGRALGLFPMGVLSAVPQARWESTRVTEVMVPLAHAAVFHADDPLTTAVERLQLVALHRGLVVDGDRLVGLLSVSDVVRRVQAGGRAPGAARP